MSPAVCVLCTALGVLSLSLVARAQPTALQLEVADDPQGCVSEAALRAHLDRFLRVHGPIDVSVVVHASEVPVGFELRHDGVFAAERRFDVLPVGCVARLDALALAIAVAVENAVGPERASLDASAVAAAPTLTEPARAEPAQVEPAQPEPPPAAPRPSAAEPTTPAAARDEPTDDAAPERPSVPLALTLAPFLGGGVLVEALLEPALTLHAGVELRLGSLFSVSLAGLFAPGVEVELAGARTSSSLLGGRVLGCLGSAPRGLRLEGCIGGAGGAVSSSGQSAALFEPSEASMGWAAGVLRAAASYPADGILGVRLALDGHLNLVQPGLRVEGDSPTERVVGPFGFAGSFEVWVALR